MTLLKQNTVLQNNSIHASETKKATTGSGGYDLFAAEGKNLQPRSITPVTIKLRMEIPDGYFGKTYSRSSLLKNYYVSCDAAGAIDPW